MFVINVSSGMYDIMKVTNSSTEFLLKLRTVSCIIKLTKVKNFLSLPNS